MNFPSVELDLISEYELLANHGLQPDGPVQQFIDNEVIKHMSKYTPAETKMLMKLPITQTKIGSGEIVQKTPYARYQYYGKLMVSSITGSAFSNGESKVLTDIDLQYSTAVNPLAGSFWFERMKADKKDAILRGVRRKINEISRSNLK